MEIYSYILLALMALTFLVKAIHAPQDLKDSAIGAAVLLPFIGKTLGWW